MPDVALSVAIQHHPARAPLAHRLFNMLGDCPDLAEGARAGVRVITDPQPNGATNPWRTARLAWSDTPDWATHQLVIQDDALPCVNFIEAARRAITARPDVAVAFFLNYLAFTTSTQMVAASRADARWVRLAEEPFVPTVALALPRAHALALALEPDPPGDIADDLATKLYADRVGLETWCTIPNLVQHDESVPSSMLGHLVPDSRQRWATCWIGDHDALALDWSDT